MARDSRLHFAGGALLAALGCVAASPAAAQAGGDRPDFSASFTVRAQYDENAARGSDQVAAVRGIEQNEWVYSASGSINVSKAFGRFDTYLAGSVGYDWHDLNGGLNSERIGLVGGANTAFGICGVGTSASWDRGQSALDELNLVVTKNVTQTVSISANASCAGPAGIQGGVNAGYSKTTNTASQGVVSSTSKSVGANVGYGNQTLGAITANVGFSRVDYPSPGTPAALIVSSRVDSVSVGLNYSRPLGRKLLGSASVGYSTTKPDGAGTSKSNDITANVQLNYRINSRLNANLSYRRNVAATILVGTSYVFNEAFSANVAYSPPGRISGSVGVLATTRDYRDQTFVLPGPRLNHDELKSVFATVSVNLTKFASMAVDARYEDRTANLATLNYNSIRAGVSFTATF